MAENVGEIMKINESDRYASIVSITNDLKFAQKIKKKKQNAQINSMYMRRKKPHGSKKHQKIAAYS